MVDKSIIFMVFEVDVTEAVMTERKVKALQNQQHELLSSILPEHVGYFEHALIHPNTWRYAKSGCLQCFVMGESNVL